MRWANEMTTPVFILAVKEGKEIYSGSFRGQKFVT